MQKGTEFKTDMGIATCVGFISNYIVSIHLDSTCNEDGVYSGDIDVLLADKENPKQLLGFLSLNDFVQCAVSDGFKTECGSISLSPDDCKTIDEISWSVLIEKYQIAPSSFVTSSDSEIVTFDPDGCKKFPNTAYVESFLGGIGRLCFEDGTLQFAENDTYPDIVYSPRLSEDKLEQFCKDNLAKYEAYFEANFDAIDKGDELPPIEFFWLN